MSKRNKSKFTKKRSDRRKIECNLETFPKCINAIATLIRDKKIELPTSAGYEPEIMTKIGKMTFNCERVINAARISTLLVNHSNYVTKCIQKRLAGFKDKFLPPRINEINNNKMAILNFLKNAPYTKKGISDRITNNTLSRALIKSTIWKATHIRIVRSNAYRYRELEIYTSECLRIYAEEILGMDVESVIKKKRRKDMQSADSWEKKFRSIFKEVNNKKSDSDSATDVQPLKRKIRLELEESEIRKSRSRKKRIKIYTDSESDVSSDLENESPGPGTSKTITIGKSLGSLIAATTVVAETTTTTTTAATETTTLTTAAEIPKERTDDVSNESVGDKTSYDTQTNTDKSTTPSDDLKVVVAEKSTEITSDANASKDNNDTSEEAKDCNELPSMEPAEKQIVEISLLNEVVITEVEDLSEDDITQTVSTEPTSSTAAADNVIDLTDESEVIKLEEITPETCAQSNSKQTCMIKVKVETENFNVCSKNFQTFTVAHHKTTDIPSDSVNSKYEKRCANCLLIVESGDDRNLSWETMEFCNEECLGKFQTKYGSYCRNCNGSVAAMCLGKYCMRFGYDVIHFCCTSCLEKFKKRLILCSYCQKEISSETGGFLAPVGDEGQFKDFCTEFCMEKYARMNSTEPPCAEKKACKVCQEEKIVHCEVRVNNSEPVAICSESCFAAFKFVNQVDPDQCSTCKKYFGQLSKKSSVVFHNKEAHTFCNKTCLNIFIITHRKIVPCNWCKVKKYNFDMIMKEFKTGQLITICSLKCLTLYEESVNAGSARRIFDFCKETSQAQYPLTMSDATVRNF